MPLKIHQLVELKDQYSNVYDRSPTGARGWVRGRREIMDHEPEVYMEWDKKHWRYQGETDGWTFEHHFRPVDDRLPEPDDARDDAHEPEAPKQARHKPQDERCPHCGEAHSPLNDRQEKFMNSLLDAQEAAIESDAFFIMTLRPRPEGPHVIYEPEIFAGRLNDVAGDMVEAQLIYTAAQLYIERVTRRLQEIENESRH